MEVSMDATLDRVFAITDEMTERAHGPRCPRPLALLLVAWVNAINKALQQTTGTPPARVYEGAVGYLVANGWRREELGSGWWWKADNFHEESTLGEALEAQLKADGIDPRVAIPGEPEEFWG